MSALSVGLMDGQEIQITTPDGVIRLKVYRKLRKCERSLRIEAPRHFAIQIGPRVREPEMADPPMPGRSDDFKFVPLSTTLRRRS